MTVANVAGRARALLLGLSALTIIPAWTQASEPVCSVTLQQAYEASGGSAWTRYAGLQVTGELEEAGVRVPFTSSTDLRSGRWRDERKRGPFQLAEGYDGDVAWAQWKPGDVIESRDPAWRVDTIQQRYERMRAYWLRDDMPAAITCMGDISRDAERYSSYRIAPRGGRPFELWLDLRTRMIARRADRNGVFERTTRYADYRETGGVRLPFLIHDVDYSGGVQIRRIERARLQEQVSERDLRKVETRLDDYTLPKGADRVETQLRLLNNHLYIPVKFNGHGPHWMMLDTGAVCLIERRFAERMGVRADGQQLLHGNGSQAAQLSYAKLDTIEIGGVTLRDQRCDIIDLQRFEEFEGVETFGLLGYEVYRRLVVRQDHAAGRIAFIERANFNPPRQARSVSFEFHEIRPVVAGSVDGIDGRFFIDTGSRNSASAYSWFVDRHALRERYPNQIEVMAGFGVGGAVRAHVTRAREIRLGDVPFKAPLLDFPIGHVGAMSGEDAAVLVGTGMLRHYGVVTFDYERRRILFEQPAPNARNDMDRSGLTLKVADQGFLVLEVLTNSPAARAGMQVDDVLVAVGNRAISPWSLPELREYLRSSPIGTSITVDAVRRGQRRSFNLILDDLL